jgi:hypothetical protein
VERLRVVARRVPACGLVAQSAVGRHGCAARARRLVSRCGALTGVSLRNLPGVNHKRPGALCQAAAVEK